MQSQISSMDTYGDDDIADSIYQFALIGDNFTESLKTKMLEFLHQKDLVSSVDITASFIKNPSTVLL